MKDKKILRKKINDNFTIYYYQIDLLNKLKDRSGINKSEQVRIALDDFFKKMGLNIDSYQL